MQNKSKLVAGAALGVLLAAGFSATAAEAKPAKKAHHAAAKSDATSAEVKALRAEVEALEQRLAAQEQAQQQTQAAAQQAQATAQTAASQAQAAQAQADSEIKTIPAQVDTAVASHKPKPTWADNTQVSGRMYYDITNIEQKRDGGKVSPSGFGFDIKRFYLGVDHKFNDTFAANITTDVGYSSATGTTNVYVKKAYLQATINPALVIRAGSADMPWIPFVEDIYGYRFVEQTLTDRTKFGNSADWGVHALGKVGFLSYQVSAVNGGGYKNPSRSKQVDVEGRVSANFDGLTLAVGGYEGKLGKDQVGVAFHHTATRFNALAAYVQPRFRVGVEYFTAKNWNNTLTLAEDKSDGTSVFGSFNFTPKTSAFARWDEVKPTKDTVSSLKDSYFNIGLNYEPVKIVDFALVYKHDDVKNGQLATGNGTIGGTAVGRKGTYDEIGVFGQLRW